MVVVDGRAAEHAFRPLTAEQEAVLHQQAPGEAVLFALRDLLECDNRLLHVDANERSITFRFAMHLQLYLQDWEIDCEFNRDGVEPKRLGHLGLYPDIEDEEAKTVFPDVLRTGAAPRKTSWCLNSRSQPAMSIVRLIAESFWATSANLAMRTRCSSR